ncbi:MAG: VRR-NUC domain-containing protein [Planctomycetota bacterium]|nr:VRR-NUC domain-containing protein [Planctomycetota bacterium]MDA1142816.1 VRR-NUC domain-containing protein [Planctomycetota bacterium]
MHRFQPANQEWWNKPLVLVDGRRLPAELAILNLEFGDGEGGVWMNSRKPESGVVDLVLVQADQFKTSRVRVPRFVSVLLRQVYETSKLKKGCPDLVIWSLPNERIRLVEVKCPHWDSPTLEQEIFMETAESLGVLTSIVEWEFKDK